MLAIVIAAEIWGQEAARPWTRVVLAACLLFCPTSRPSGACCSWGVCWKAGRRRGRRRRGRPALKRSSPQSKPNARRRAGRSQPGTCEWRSGRRIDHEQAEMDCVGGGSGADRRHWGAAEAFAVHQHLGRPAVKTSPITGSPRLLVDLPYDVPRLYERDGGAGQADACKRCPRTPASAGGVTRRPTGSGRSSTSCSWAATGPASTRPNTAWRDRAGILIGRYPRQ